MLAMVLLSCGGGGNGAADGEKAVMRYAQYLSITGCDGYSVAEINLKAMPYRQTCLKAH